MDLDRFARQGVRGADADRRRDHAGHRPHDPVAGVIHVAIFAAFLFFAIVAGDGGAGRAALSCDGYLGEDRRLAVADGGAGDGDWRHRRRQREICPQLSQDR